MLQFIVVTLFLFVAGILWRNWSRQRRLAYIETFPYQRLLDWRLAARQPGLSEAERGEVFATLADYFAICHTAGRRMVAMPSQAVDDAWHEFILFTRQYGKFCRKAFGRFLHHTPAEAMSAPTQASAGLRRAWRLACRREGIDPQKPTLLPRLFALDSRLGIAGGFVYHLDCMAARPGGEAAGYCASHIGCGGTGGSDGCGGDSGGSCGSGCSSGCGGGD